MQPIFIHGLGQTSSSWKKTLAFMPDETRALCPNLCEIIGSNDVTYTNLYHAFAEYCNEAPSPVNLCGLSLGRIIALNYTIDYPGRVNSLVLIGTQYKMPKLLLKIQNGIFRILPQAMFKGMGFQKRDIISLTNSMTNIDFSEQLKKISCPTLIICGEKDSANKKAAKSLYENISGAKFTYIENAGHATNEDNPQKLAFEIENFFAL